MNIFFDTEFTGLHKDTTLISIGCVDENGRTFYAELADYDESQVDNWILENVVSHLKFANTPQSEPVINIYENGWEVYGDKKQVKEVLRDWLSKYDSVQLVSDVCHYDMVLFIDLFGNAFDLPSNVNASCHDINQDIAADWDVTEREAFDMSREKLLAITGARIDGDKHNSLYDAKVIRAIYNEIIEHE